MKFSASGPAVCLAPGLWAYTAVFSRYTQNSGENRRIFLKDPDFWAAAHKPSLLCPKSPDFLGIGEKSTVLCPKAPSIPCIGMYRINFHPWQPVCPLVHRLELAGSCRSPHWRRHGAAHSIRYVSQLLFVTLPNSNYSKILQIKRRYSIIHSDVLTVRLFYPVPSCVIMT